MNFDSEREKSSTPNEDTSSENRTFHDDDDDFSPGEIESDVELESNIVQIEPTPNITLPPVEHSKEENAGDEIKVEYSKSSVQKNTDENIYESSVIGNFETNKLNALQIDIVPTVESFAKEPDIASVVKENASEDQKFEIKIDDCFLTEWNEILSMNKRICRHTSKSDSDVEMEDLSTFKAPIFIKKKYTNAEEKTSDSVYELKGPYALVDQPNFRRGMQDFTECFYSAQDLLEYGTILTGDLKMPDVESGFFEKSESDHSKDETDASTSTLVRLIKPRTTFKVQKTLLSASENVRVEVNKIKAMITSIEKELENTHNFEGMTKQEIKSTIDCSSANCVVSQRSNDLIADKNYYSKKGYWSTVFGEASQFENAEEISMTEHLEAIQQAHRALELLEDYHSRLSDPQDRALRIAIERVIRIFKSRLFQALLARDFMEAYRCQTQCVQVVVKMLQQLKEENWCLPIMYTVCLDLRILAQRCEEFGSSSKPGEILEKAADCLMSCFRVCAADNRSSDDDTKRLGMLNLVNQLFKVYFRINKLHLCKPLIRAIDSSVFRDSFPLPEQITYKYFVGRKAMFDSDYKNADEFLSFALANCPPNFPRNKRLILIYLVPVKMLLGYMPKKQILERFDVLQFHELAVALKEGNVRKFDEIIQRHEIFFIKCGIYLLVEKLKFIVYRNLFKKVYLIKQTHQLDLRDFRAALQFVGETNMSIDETHCIVANLIFEGKIKGYISHSHNKLVVSKQNPFPPLNTVS